MGSAKEIFAFIAAFAGAITGIMALAKTYLELKKLLAEKPPEKATAPPVHETPSAPPPPAPQLPPPPALPTAAPSPVVPAPAAKTVPQDHDKLMMGIALQIIGIIVIIAGVAWLLYPIIYPPPIDWKKPPVFDPAAGRGGFLHWPVPQLAVCGLGNLIWKLGRPQRPLGGSA